MTSHSTVLDLFWRAGVLTGWRLVVGKICVLVALMSVFALVIAPGFALGFGVYLDPIEFMAARNTTLEYFTGYMLISLLLCCTGLIAIMPKKVFTGFLSHRKSQPK